MPANMMNTDFKCPSVFVIAEAGVNHDGDLGLALELAEVAAECGADAVKFQSFSAEKLVTRGLPAAAYQNQNIGYEQDQIDVLKGLELSQDQTRRIAQKCEAIGIEFLSTAFDADSLAFLVHEIGVRKLKIASGEITNGPLLFKHATAGLPILLSTGMTSFAEIDGALSVLAAGFSGNEPSAKSFAGLTNEGHFVVPEFEEKVTLLQCTTQYPAPVAESNIRAMKSMKDRYQLDIGFSDHTKGGVAAIVAVANGASVIEKHITTDNKKTSGPDHKASMNPDEFREFVRQIRIAEVALGTDQKQVQPSEAENIAAARKYIVAAQDIEEGERFSEQNLKTMRAGRGLSPMHYWRLLGTIARRKYTDGDPIEEE